MKTFYNKYLKYHKKYFRLYNKLQSAGALDTKSINIGSLIQESENVIKDQSKAKPLNIDSVIKVAENIKEQQKKDAEPGFFNSFVSSASNMLAKVGTEATKLKDAVVDKVEDVKKLIDPTMKEASDKVAKLKSELEDTVEDTIEDVKKSLEPALKDTTNKVAKLKADLVDTVEDTIEDVKKSLGPALKEASNEASELFKEASDKATRMTKSASEEVSKLKDELSMKVEDAKKSLEPALKEASRMLESASSEASKIKADIMQSATSAKQTLDNTLASASTMADSIKNEYAELKEKATTVKSDIMQKIQSELGPLQASILGNLNNEFNKVSSATSNINSQYKDIEDKVAVMKNEMSNSMDTVNKEVKLKISEAVNEEMNKVKQSIEIFKSRYEEMNKQIVEVQGKFDALSQSEMQRLQGQMDMMMGQMKGQLEAQLVELKNKMNISLPPSTNQELLNKVETLSAYVSNLNLSVINQQLDSLNRTVNTDMKVALDNMNKQIYNIGLASQSGHNTDLNSKIEKLQHMVEEMQVKNNDVKIENLQSDVDKLKLNDTNSLKTSVTGLQDEVARIGAYIQHQASVVPQEHVVPAPVIPQVDNNLKQVVENLDTNSKEVKITLDNLRRDLDAVKMSQTSTVPTEVVNSSVQITLDNLRKDLDTLKLAQTSTVPTEVVSNNMPLSVNSGLTTISETINKLSEQVKSLEEKANKVPELERKIEEILARLNNQPFPEKPVETPVKAPVEAVVENKSLIDKLKDALNGDSAEASEVQVETTPSKMEQPNQVEKLQEILVGDTESPNLFMNYLGAKKSKN